MIASFTSICDAKRWIIQRKIINLSKQFFRPAGRPRVFTQPRLFPSETSSPNGSLCSMDQKPGFDIIGDVHGHAALLEKLLRKLGYVKYGKTWGHPDGRIAVFTGDLINRGPEQVETVKLVRRMVRHETAYCVAGNHEYAALCRFCGIGHVHGTDSRITFFDSAVKDPKTLQKLMKWIRTLPLWLNLGEIRVVHACWDPDAIQSILDACVREGALPTLGLYEDVLRSSGEESDAGQSLIAALDQTLKRPEVWLPKTLSYKNAEGKAVTRVRVKWWDRGITTYEAAVISDPSRSFPLEDLRENPFVFKPTVPTFIGHYSLSDTGNFAPLDTAVACVDYGAGKGGPLTAYRWNRGDRLPLDKKRFTVVYP